MTVEKYERSKKHEILFQQDTFAIITKDFLRDWFCFNFVRLFDWLAHLLNLNPIENIWCAMVRDIYDDRIQFYTFSKIMAAIIQNKNCVGLC